MAEVNLSGSITQAEAAALSQELVLDLEASFSYFEAKMLEMLEAAETEGWSAGHFVDEVHRLIDAV